MNAPSVVSLVHLGCARNLIDSELILGRLAEAGLVVSGDPSAAGTIVLNTCSFIGPAREESESRIRELLKKKRRGEITNVVVAGCLVQRFKRTLVKRFPAVDLFAEISDGAALAKSIRELADGKKINRYLESPGLREPARDAARMLSTPKSFAYLRISHGCDHVCSFCAIPAIRGPHRSKRVEDLVGEARELIDAGVRELVLVAEDSTAWGRDHGLELPHLVETLADLDGDHRLRVMYAYPNRFPWELTRLLRDHPKVLPYLDIPVQHISAPVLRAMRRAGSGEQVRRILDRLFEEVPGITLRTTVLVGFPGETPEHVHELETFIRSYRLGRLGAFGYSPEEGTTGNELAERVDEDEIDVRLGSVLATRDAVLEANQKELIGRELEVVIDQAADADGEALGRTWMDAPEVDLIARVTGVGAEVGDVVKVRAEGLDEEYNLRCTPVESPA
ncbi:MAG: 30S ribosomal protein S12 methylthiotransferase RimO [Planctomycetes bacterium]|nr:30S ribosomal protein S12 methylthiotransferase RimO [Planctomycetota bacterium]